MARKKSIKTLYKDLLSLEEKIKATYELFSERDRLLEEIYMLYEGPQEIKLNKDIRLLEVVEQKGHYVYHRPFRLSNKKAA